MYPVLLPSSLLLFVVVPNKEKARFAMARAAVVVEIVVATRSMQRAVSRAVGSSSRLLTRIRQTHVRSEGHQGQLRVRNGAMGSNQCKDRIGWAPVMPESDKNDRRVQWSVRPSIRGVLVEGFIGRRRLVGEECFEKAVVVAGHSSAFVGRR